MGRRTGKQKSNFTFFVSLPSSFSGVAEAPHLYASSVYFLAVSARNPYMKKKHIRILIRILKLEWKEIEIISKGYEGEIKGLYVCKISQHWKKGVVRCQSLESMSFWLGKASWGLRARCFLLVVRYYWRSVYAYTDFVHVEEATEDLHCSGESLITCSKSGAVFLLFCSYE